MQVIHPCLLWLIYILILSAITIEIISLDNVKARGGPVSKKKANLAYIEFQPVIELLLFTESQNLLYDENMACQTSGVLLIPIQNIGG